MTANSDVSSAPPSDPRGVYPRLAVVALLRDKSGRWLLVRPCHDPARWSPVGGRVEPGETLAGALRRELREEVGLEARILAPCYAALVSHKGEDTLAVTLAAEPGTTADATTGHPPAVGGAVATAAAAAARPVPDEVAEVGWFTREKWTEFARAGKTPWAEEDVLRATTLAETLLDAPPESQHLADDREE